MHRTSGGRREHPEFIRALLEPRCYPHETGQIQLLETHISWVLLTGPYAYKIKKPVDLGFLDFSTLERRLHYCQEELRLNRRLAPHLYLAVESIGGGAAEPRLGATAGVFEYAVKMRQFDPNCQLDCLLAEGSVTPAQMDRFAELIAGFHGHAEVEPPQGPYGRPAAILKTVTDVAEQIYGAGPEPEILTRVQALKRWVRETHQCKEDIFAARQAGGAIRECHGDMHLRNLAWLDDEPVAFDCIEFNAAFRWIDVISEVAFLIMDLDDHGRADLGRRFLNAYLQQTGDFAGLRLLPFYLVYRALVRAMVAALRARQEDVAAEERAALEEELEKYLQLAEAYRSGGRPFVVLMRGLSGSGKSTVALSLVERFDAVQIRSDVERKRLFGLAASQSARGGIDEGIYSPAASRRTYDHLLELADLITQADKGVIVDAVFASVEQRLPFLNLARERGLPFLIVECQADYESLCQRLRARRGDASDADIDVLDQQRKSWRPVSAEERPYLVEFDTAGEQALSVVTERLPG